MLILYNNIVCQFLSIFEYIGDTENGQEFFNVKVQEELWYMAKMGKVKVQGDSLNMGKNEQTSSSYISK